MRLLTTLFAAILSLMFCAAAARAAEFDSRPWLADLAQVRGVLDTRYANRDWLVQDRGVDLDALFAGTADRVKAARSEADARAAFDRLVRRIGDGHLEIDWTRADAADGSPGKPCDGFNPAFAKAGPATALPGYRALPGDALFPAGIAPVGAARVGIVRISIFGPQGEPALCPAALQVLKLAPDQACDEACAGKVVRQAEILMTARFETRLRDLKAAGATVLLVDLSDNPGGSEWAEAAVRMVTARSLRSARMGFVRGPQWVKSWGDLETKLRAAAEGAPPADRARLLALAAEAAAGKREAGRTCDGTACARLGVGGFSTGLVERATASEFAGKPWGEWVFFASEYPYREGFWRGPLIVLVNQESWSAAEEFAAMLQDNHAAVILGERTGGAGCGHTDNSAPVVLTNSGARLSVPDCVRFRADGSNEVRGVVPDVLVGSKLQDGRAFKAELIAGRLPEAVRRAQAQAQGR